MIDMSVGLNVAQSLKLRNVTDSYFDKSTKKNPNKTRPNRLELRSLDFGSNFI